MKWFMNNGENSDVVVSTRVRLARNIDNFPFPQKLDAQNGTLVIESVKNALDSEYSERLNYIDLTKKNDTELSALVEDHLISNEFCKSTVYPKMLITNEENNISIMVNEEDHLRIQAIFPGFALNEAYTAAQNVDEAIEKKQTYAFDDTLGYLTSCPTNLGTGLRASVMVHIPALCKSGYLKSLSSILTKLGLTVRGLYGEGTEGHGCFFQISNQITLGIDENAAIEKLQSAVKQIIAKEREQRKLITEDVSMQDKLCRSVGILKTARKMSAAEAIQLISDARLCAHTGLVEGLQGINLLKLMIDIMPSHIILQNSLAQNNALQRDTLRASIIRKQLEKAVI